MAFCLNAKYNFTFIIVILTLNQNFKVYPTCNTRLKRRITVNEALNQVSFHQHLSLRKNSPRLEFSGPYFPTFRLNTERYSVSLRIQSKCRKIRTRITPNTDTFHAVCLESRLNIEKIYHIVSITFAPYKTLYVFISYQIAR